MTASNICLIIVGIILHHSIQPSSSSCKVRVCRCPCNHYYWSYYNCDINHPDTIYTDGNCYHKVPDTWTHCGWKGWHDRDDYYYGWWWWRVENRCCDGYGGTNCDIPICGGGASSTSCQRNEGRVVHKNGLVVTNSGGRCIAPMVCVDCNTGYYPNTDGFCRACRQIENCNIKRCTQYSDTVCDWCVGELIRERAGYNVFTGLPDNTQCQRACSWRDGWRCFPGSCTGDMIFANNCRCSRGFGGHNCATATADKLPEILTQIMKLEGDGYVKKFIMDIPTANGKFWTNEPQWETVTINATSSYKPEIDAARIPSYIERFEIGIDDMEIQAILTRGQDKAEWKINKECYFEERCAEDIFRNIQSTPWNNILQGGFPRPFFHQDLITFTVSAKNGGKIVYTDREKVSLSSYLITGISRTLTFQLGFDMYPPQHCYEVQNVTNCISPPLLAKDYNKKPNITVHWGDWLDHDSGIHRIVFNMFLLEVKDRTNPILDPKLLTFEKMINYTASVSSTDLPFNNTGPYAIEILVYDLAGNHKTARRIAMFDDISKVELQGNPIKILQANEQLWINKFSNSLQLSWKGRFINSRHHSLGWLAEVRDNPVISQELDDSAEDSERSVDAINNINGTVRTDIAYLVELDGQSQLIDYQPSSLEEFNEQQKVFTSESLVDGKRITYFVRGVDCMEEYAEDNVTVIIDLSPPKINNLWLTKGDFLNISVHSVQELQDLTIEWEVHDEHSGIHEISWKIFDNYTGSDIVHGQSHESPQGETQTLKKCKQKYSTYARGENCYCTPYNGCYHRHYQVKPQLTNTGSDGIHLGKETGVHDYDYYIQVKAVNNARLELVQYYKITIDISPPHAGSVHDGIPGQPEVDFQQSLTIHAFWDDFFDKESGVWLYMYGFANRCLSKGELDIHSRNGSSVYETYESAATFTAPGPGKYYCTVMAYNHALDNSQTVCSDGVTVDFEVPVVTEVVVKGARTAKGLIQDDVSSDIYLLYENREISQIVNQPADCLTATTTVSSSSIQALPHRRLADGTKSNITLPQTCSEFRPIHKDIPAVITTNGYLEMSWNASGNIHDFEVGISSQDSDIPDLMDFQSSDHHQHIRLYHPDIFNGDIFYVVIKAVTKSSVPSLTVVGPFALDSTPPDCNGQITVSVEPLDTADWYLIAKWPSGSFEDHGDPNILSYEVAIGSSKGGKDVLAFRSLTGGGTCLMTVPPTCTAISTALLPWHLHGQQVYYISVKATNTAGLFVVASSDPYYHNVIKPTVGVVFDVDNTADTKFIDIDDIDFQTGTNQLSVRWSGFYHPHEDITFCVCLAKDISGPYVTCSDNINGDATTFTITNLSLDAYQTYYQIVIAQTEAGNITAVSDGVTIVVDNDHISGVRVFDGPICNNTGNSDLQVNSSHHDEDKRVQCSNDLDYQMSQNRLQAHWSIPDNKRHFLRDIFWAVEERAPIADIWTLFAPYERLTTFSSFMETSGLHLSPGKKYRISMKFCADRVCFQPVHSNGFTCIPNPPIVGKLSVIYDGRKPEIQVALEKFRDSDIEDFDQSLDVMDHYEWALTDSSNREGMLTTWNRAVTRQSITWNELLFLIPLKNKITFTKCWRVLVRGYTKAGSSAVGSSEIRNCSNLLEVKPAIVLDALGDASDEESRHEGNPILLQENGRWDRADADFTPFNNIISAVWPTLRHKDYTWAILTVNQEDPTILYEDTTYLNLKEPCLHPDVLKCGHTDKEYINVEFVNGQLLHGYRYIVCIHANATTLNHEIWSQELPEVNSCSDGITVDLTPPVPAKVWIGYDKTFLYQTSKTDMTINWNSFVDVEEDGTVAHSSGVAKYEVAIGTYNGGADIIPFTNVGVTNHKTFHRLSLQSGHTYFATVKGYDFTGQTSTATSNAVKVDTTPPEVTQSVVKINARHITDSSYVDACWNGVFTDTESGISHYSWAVGTKQGYDEVMSFIDTTEECARNSKDKPLNLKEGHAYFVNVKGYNPAGLYSMATSWAFIVDESPPVPGLVCDGSPTPMVSCSDIDFINDTSTLNVHWTEFYEPHTHILSYYISVGSCRKCDDMLSKQPIGIRNQMELSALRFAQGERYYVTITACNTAEICSASSSDGFVVDSSPPIPGFVIDGNVDSDIQYQASRKHIGCKWYGFNDPQSGISHFIWRVGTTQGGDDILPSTDVHKSQEAFVFDLPGQIGKTLPLNKKMYCTVRAINNAGKSSESFSNGFIVDTTPPIFTAPLSLAPIGSIVSGTSVLRSTLKVSWNVQDEESFVETQYLSITSHIGGDFNLSSIKITGIVRDFTFTGLDLHDGSYYDVTLYSCNGAKLCATSKVVDILIDSTPPTAGTFAINTDHAAGLQRQPDDWMSWTSISINLAWLGFEDVHTGIDKYVVNIGSTYMNNDLNEQKHVPMVVNHSLNVSFLQDGFVQTQYFQTQPLTKHKSVYISIRALNKVGLSSDVVHSKFNLVYGGLLDLVRRCDSHSCLGHCVCAPHGQQCKERSICNDTSAIRTEEIGVKDYLDLTFSTNSLIWSHTPDNTLMAARWYLKTAVGKRPQWYEWSVGESAHDTPTGVFNAATERVWHDSGKEQQWSFLIKRGHRLVEDTQYSFFVRAWYDERTFAVFKSKGIIVLSRPPATTSIRGRAVKEAMAEGAKDIDFIRHNSHLFADWTEKFINAVNSLARFHCYLSTTPGGHDLHLVAADLAPTVTRVNISGLGFAENTRYYTVVQAYNLAGLHTTETSDGFMLDHRPPNTGIVQHGSGLSNIFASNSTDTLELNWHGFLDSEAGIQSYKYCVFVDRIECTPDTMRDVGLLARIVHSAPSTFMQGSRVKFAVQATDAAGQVSDFVVSNGVIIDSTSPVRVKTIQHLDNILANPSFEDVTTHECGIENTSWTVQTRSCAQVVETSQAHDGTKVLHVQGTVSQVMELNSTGKYRLVFYTSTIPSDHPHLSSAAGFVEVNNEKHTFLIYDRQKSESYVWQKHTFYFHVSSKLTTLLLGTVGTLTSLVFDDVSMQRCVGSTVEPDFGTSHVTGHVVLVHDWSSLHAEWDFLDNETEIVDYSWAIGTVRGGTQLKQFTSVGKRTFASIHSLRLEHNTNVYITVVAENAAELRTVSYSDPVMIDLTPPVFKFVHEGPIYGDDLDYQRELILVFHWNVYDVESGIKECFWALGTFPGDVSVQEFSLVVNKVQNYSKSFATPPADTLYVTIKCTNGADLTSTEHSDGIKILQDPPTTDDVILELMTSSKTQFPTRGFYHGDKSEIKFRWIGFDNKDGVSSYMIALYGGGKSISEIVKGSVSGFNYASFTGLDLDDGMYNVSLIGINEVKMFSERITANFYLLTDKPALSGSPMQISYSKQTHRATTSWKDVFVSSHPLYYEVTAKVLEAGEGDLVQWQETTSSQIVLDLADILPPSGGTVQFSVRAVNYAGLYEVQYGNIFI